MKYADLTDAQLSYAIKYTECEMHAPECHCWRARQLAVRLAALKDEEFERAVRKYGT